MQPRKTEVTAFIFLSILLASVGVYFYAALNGITLNEILNCHGDCSDVMIQLNSNSPIQNISVDLSQAPAKCFQGGGGVCLAGVTCTYPNGFCANINSTSNTTKIVFHGVEQGYYWIVFNANIGNGSRGQVNGMHIVKRFTYYVVANMTAYLATLQIAITNSSTS